MYTVEVEYPYVMGVVSVVCPPWLEVGVSVELVVFAYGEVG